MLSNWLQTGAAGIGDVAAAPDGRIWAAGLNGTVWYSDDQGKRFIEITAYGIVRISVGPDSVLWGVGTNGSLWSCSTIGFAAPSPFEWTRSISVTDAADVAVAPDQSVWLTRKDGSIALSSDRGVSFSRIDASGFSRLSADTDNSIWAVGINGTLWRRLSSGQWFQTVASGMQDVGVELLESFGGAYSGRIWLAGKNGTVWLSSDKGQTFTQMTDAQGFASVAGAGAASKSSFFSAEEHAWFVGANGTLWRRLVPAKIGVLQSSVSKVCQFTGENSFNATGQYGLYGTDLGYSFEHAGRLWFLFGDTWPSAQCGVFPRPDSCDDKDSIAWTTDTLPEPGIHLKFISDNGRYRSPRLIDSDGKTELSTAGFQVPAAGFSVNDNQMYIIHTTGSIEEGIYDDGLDAFWLGNDGAIHTTWSNPSIDIGSWRTPYAITPSNAARADSPIAALVRLGNAIDVFWISPEGAITTTYSNPNLNDKGAWHMPFRISDPGTARPGSPVVALTRLSDGVDVFWIAPGGAVFTTWFNPQLDNGAWHKPFAIAGPGSAHNDSPLAALTRLQGALDVFWIRPDGAVATNYANPAIAKGAWQTPFRITDPGATRAASPIAAVTRLKDAVDVFWIAPNGAVFTTWFNPQLDSGAWHKPFAIAGPGSARDDSPLDAITRLQGSLDVFWVGPDSAVATNYANPAIAKGAWQTPFNVTPANSVRSGSPLRAVTRLHDAVQIFWAGPDSAARTTGFSPAMDGGRWQPPSSISTPFESKVKSAISGISRTNGFTDPNSMARESVLAIANDNDPTHLTVKYHFSDLLDRPNGGGKFINIACVEASDSRGDLPFEPALLVWGSGRLRESNVYLACAPLSSIESRSSWRYFSGMSLSSGPIWLPDEHAAIPLFDHRQVGELSVMRVEGLGVWLMTYNASAPRGINARVACSPWGPWSDPILLYDPNWPNVGYGAIMRSLDSRGGPCDPGREDIWGGEYGAYLIKRYTRYIQAPSPSPLRAKIYFVMSTWNPYNTVLMTAEILREPVLSS